MIMKKITGLIIQIDPIQILKTYLGVLEKNLQDMDKQIAKLKGTMVQLKRKIDDNAQKMNSNLELAKQAQKRGRKSDTILKARKAGRLQESNMTLEKLYIKMEVVYRVLSKMYENCSFLYEDTKDQIEVKESEWKAIQQSHQAIKAAMSIIRGDKDKKAIYEQALEFMADDLGNKIGEMERFMEVSEGFMSGIDLQNDVFEEKGLEMLEQWEAQADSIILGDEKVALISQAESQNDILDLDKPKTSRVSTRENQYNKLF